ncbi:MULTISPECIES: hypothetical protein [Paracoccus]|uniref:Uncharacterized protein n=1 Tax=Paracoccus rhizosphaerae TaxID=1133347 RepID=A0ABV6CFS6_9RHOB|nr:MULTISPECIES: hypothetical protein [Paracoccus]
MTDQDHVDAIQTAVLNLNTAIEAEAKDGMLCELMIFHNHTDERTITFTLLGTPVHCSG